MKEAIDYLNGTDAVEQPLLWNTNLSLSCKDLVEDLGSAGLVQMNTSQGVTPIKRIERYGQVMSSFGQSLAFNYETPFEAVM